MKCVFVHHNNPYLILGPFKFEVKHSNPEIAIIHDFISVKLAHKVKNLARGKMKSTPYFEQGQGRKDFSKDRTSKVMYLSDNLAWVLLNFSSPFFFIQRKQTATVLFLLRLLIINRHTWKLT